MNLWRRKPKDDEELAQVTGIKTPDHQFVPRSAIEKMERKMLGPDWYRKRPEQK
jgi:hypothetical protein